MIIHVPPKLAYEMWSVLSPLFAKVTPTTNGCYEPDDILVDVLSGKQTLWVAWDDEKKIVDAAMTTCFVNYPRRRTLRGIFVAGGNMKAWFPEWVETIERYAREGGATALEGSFRKGWARLWPAGRIGGVSLFKDLTA